MTIKDDKIQTTNTISSVDLDRYEGTVKLVREAWENMPEDVEIAEREMFVEIASKVLSFSKLREQEKDNRKLN